MADFIASIRSRLFSLTDPSYRDFQCKLMPTVNPDTVLGVRTPDVRALARALSGTSEAEAFIRVLPHTYYEENNLHGFLIERIQGFDRAMTETDAFLPYIDNWATCDSISPKIFRKNLPALYVKIQEWIRSEHVYTIRFGIEMLMRFYLDEYFQPEHPALVAGIASGEYYVRMMVAWYFATALAKRYDESIFYFTAPRLDEWTHNRAIQKALESRRISAERKAYLRTLKVKSARLSNSPPSSNLEGE